MSRILFIDPVCNKPYTGQTLRTRPLGGTEASVIRIAEALGETAAITVMQHNRRDVTVDGSVTYAPIGFGASLECPDAVVLLRAPMWVKLCKATWPQSRLVLWTHDLAGDHLRFDLSRVDTLVTVSDFHRTNTVEYLKATGTPFPKELRRIYNPIEDALQPSGEAFDRNKLVWFSSPHKGLSDALVLFKNALNFNPEFKLYVSNPGYFKDADTSLVPGVRNLGSLAHHEAISHVRGSLCVFYPNFRYPETFGLVMAEANAVGTPVLTCPIGAAREVLDNPAPQCVDGRNPKSVLDRLMAWYGDNRPTVTGRDIFRTSVVAREWKRLLLCK